LPKPELKKGVWVQKADFVGVGRYEAVGFSIGNKGYVGTGSYGSESFQDFWEYDPASNSWTQKADFAGGTRLLAVGFSIGNKGYIGTGRSNSSMNDFWEYDPVSNNWTQKADFAGGVRECAVGFSIGNKGYIGTGFSVTGPEVFVKDFWEYDPLSNVWTQKADFTGGGRDNAVGFSIGNKGYIGTGSLINGLNENDFWEYDPVSNSWTQKANFAGEGRIDAVGFSIGNKGYIGTGCNYIAGSGVNSFYQDFWEYDPVSNSWTQKADFAGGTIDNVVGFSIANKGYINYLQNFYEFTP